MLRMRCAFRSALRYDLHCVQCTGPSYTPRQSTLRSKLLSDLSQKSTVDDNEKDCVAQMDKKRAWVEERWGGGWKRMEGRNRWKEESERVERRGWEMVEKVGGGVG